MRERHGTARHAPRRHSVVARAASDVLGPLSACIAHEVNQPLGAILANVDAAEIILEHAQPDLDELRQIVRDIRSDGMRASGVIASMRRLFRRRPLALLPLELNDIVTDALRSIVREAQCRDIGLDMELDDDVPRIAGDDLQLQQVVVNLAMNALDAASGLPHAEVRVRTRSRHGGAEILVEDDGTGMSPAEMDQLFRPFFTTKPQGTGLGLSIVRSIVDAHRGRVWAEPAAARGATFHVWLPALASP